MSRTSAKPIQRRAVADELKQARSVGKTIASGLNGPPVPTRTSDSLINFMAKLGLGADNMLSASTYGFNPITRQRVLLEWIHRGSWIGGVAIDVVADDMTRAGVDIIGALGPEERDRIGEAATRLDVWGALNDTVKWSRLYGGCIAVHMVAGQDYSTPLRVNTIGKDQYKGMLVLDRWMVNPSVDNLVSEEGPFMGLPKFYDISMGAPGLRGKKVHYSRVIRLEGIRLPYWQRVVENLWGESELERVYDRLVSFDSATTGAAQLVFKVHLRTYKIKDLRSISTMGEDAMLGLLGQIELMRRFQSSEGITLLDTEDEFEVQPAPTVSGLAETLVHFGQQISGALQIPLVRLFGQSPSGLNSSGESDLKTYYDGILQKQKRQLFHAVSVLYRMLAMSEGIKVPDGFGVEFRSLWQLEEGEKATIAQTDTQTVTAAVDAGLITPATGMRELRNSSRATGRWSSITDDIIEEADSMDQVPAATQVEAAEVKAGEEPGVEEQAGKKPTGTGDAAWEESEHSRKNNGEFGSGTVAKKTAAKTATKTPKTKASTGSASLMAAPKNRAAWPAHIQAMRIPPAWTDVHIASDPKAALQATGSDAKGRKQYVYSKEFAASQSAQKFNRVKGLVKDAPVVAKQIERGRTSSDLALKGHADCAHLIMSMGIRPGSDTDTQAKVKAYGATTLLGQHVVSDKQRGVTLQFVGKKGVHLDLAVTDKGLAKMLVERSRSAGKDGKLFPEVSQSSMLNYVHTRLDHGNYKTKDFRTLFANNLAVEKVKSMGAAPISDKSYKAMVLEVAKHVSSKLGNTPTVALQSYISPQVFAAWKGAISAY